MQKRKSKLEQAQLKKRISPIKRKWIMFQPFIKSARNQKGIERLARKNSGSSSEGYIDGVDRIDRATWRKIRREMLIQRGLISREARRVRTRSSSRRSSRLSTEQVSPRGTRDKSALHGDSGSPKGKKTSPGTAAAAKRGAAKQTAPKKTAAKNSTTTVQTDEPKQAAVKKATVKKAPANKSTAASEDADTKQSMKQTARRTPLGKRAMTANKTASATQQTEPEQTLPNQAPAKAPAKRGGKATTKAAPTTRVGDQGPASSPGKPSAKRSADSDDLDGQVQKRARRSTF
ncbi:hypothetical protein JDV02_003324 [Purpureocillium takamizusanense]|uniref:Uncharacterized protein n=1 Tax=Purpureocillium takamizusanense TaxID=2060973 RepID=A0A9Q8QDW2_9HYPO|nr:uncharacterized protein JDV02_003324 [Purpureocillium takamizusanense]UNI16942.1 hypothetical protein JDV02_003324 [Purpureocillium takamizusanense]